MNDSTLIRSLSVLLLLLYYLISLLCLSICLSVIVFLYGCTALDSSPLLLSSLAKEIASRLLYSNFGFRIRKPLNLQSEDQERHVRKKKLEKLVARVRKCLSQDLLTGSCIATLLREVFSTVSLFQFSTRWRKSSAGSSIISILRPQYIQRTQFSLPRTPRGLISVTLQ